MCTRAGLTSGLCLPNRQSDFNQGRRSSWILLLALLGTAPARSGAEQVSVSTIVSRKKMFHHVPSHMLTPDYGRHLVTHPHTVTGMPMHLDVKETSKEYRVCCDLPGVEKNKIDVSVDDRVLTITAERSEAKDLDDENTHFSERRHGKSSRSLRLPPDANEDAIRAQHENGVLNIFIQKKEKSESTARPVQITGPDYPFCK